MNFYLSLSMLINDYVTRNESDSFQLEDAISFQGIKKKTVLCELICWKNTLWQEGYGGVMNNKLRTVPIKV